MQVAICVADVLDQILDGALLGDIDLAIHHLCTQGPQGGQAGIIGQGRAADQDEDDILCPGSDLTRKDQPQAAGAPGDEIDTPIFPGQPAGSQRESANSCQAATRRTPRS